MTQIVRAPCDAEALHHLAAWIDDLPSEPRDVADRLLDSLNGSLNTLATSIADLPAHSRADAAAKIRVAAIHADWTPERVKADDCNQDVIDAVKATQEAIAWLER